MDCRGQRARIAEEQRAWIAEGKEHVVLRVRNIENFKIKYMAKFRFEDLEIWKLAIEIGMEIFDIADKMEELKLFRFMDQARGVGMSISNNIAESTGTNQVGEQRQLLRYSRRECFEAVNILIILRLRNIITKDEIEKLKSKLEILSRKVYNYSNSLQ